MLKSKRKRIIITGASDTVGEVIVDALLAQYELIVFNSIPKKHNFTPSYA